MAHRLSLYPKLLLLTLAAAFLFVVSSGDGSTTASGRVGGDYPAFYSAGTLVADGRTSELYDATAQAEVQEDLLGTEEGYLSFAYAPHVAAAYAPLAELPYRASYVVHTMLMVAALVLGLHLLRPVITTVDRWFALVLAATVTSYPMFVALGGGQNTALTFLALAAVWRALADDRDELAGLAVALLLFRPQYAIPLIGLLLLGRRHRAVLVAVAGCAVTFAANAAVLGWSWVSVWTDRIGPFLEKDAEVNAANAVSTYGFFQAVLGIDSPVALVLGIAGSLAVILALAALWYFEMADLSLRMGATAVGIVLLSPHAMFYDSALLTLAVLVLVDRGDFGWRFAAAIWALGLAHLAKGLLDITPFALVVAALFVLIVRRAAPADTGAPKPLVAVGT